MHTARAIVRGPQWLCTARHICLVREPIMDRPNSNSPPTHERQRGRAGWILLWLLGVPIPILLILFLLRGCT